MRRRHNAGSGACGLTAYVRFGSKADTSRSAELASDSPPRRPTHFLWMQDRGNHDPLLFSRELAVSHACQCCIHNPWSEHEPHFRLAVTVDLQSQTVILGDRTAAK